MGCRRSWAVDDDRSQRKWAVDEDRRRIRWEVDVDRCHRRWAIDNNRCRRRGEVDDYPPLQRRDPPPHYPHEDRSQRRRPVDLDRHREALQVAQINASLDRMIDSCSKFIHALDQKLSSATIPTYSPSILTSAPTRLVDPDPVSHDHSISDQIRSNWRSRGTIAIRDQTSSHARSMSCTLNPICDTPCTSRSTSSCDHTRHPHHLQQVSTAATPPLSLALNPAPALSRCFPNKPAQKSLLQRYPFAANINIIKGDRVTGPLPPPFSISTSRAPNLLATNLLPESYDSYLQSDPKLSFTPANLFSSLVLTRDQRMFSSIIEEEVLKERKDASKGKAMEELLLVECDFTRTLPSGLGHCRNLHSLWIYNDRISGYVLAEMWKQPHIWILELNNGYVTGIGVTYLSMLLTNQFTRNILSPIGLMLSENAVVILLKFIRVLHGLQHCAASIACTGVELLAIARLAGVYRDPTEKACRFSIFKANANADCSNLESVVDFYHNNMKNVSETIDWRKDYYSKLFTEQQTQRSPTTENKVFDEKSKRNEISFTSIIYGYAQNCQPDETFKLFAEMYNKKIKPDQVVMVRLMSACAQLDMSVNCGNMERAAILFDLIQIRDMVSYCSLLPGYSILGFGAKVVELFDEMIKEGIIPYDFAFIVILTPCRQASIIEEGIAIWLLREEKTNVDDKDFTNPRGYLIVPFLSAIHLNEGIYPGALPFNPWRRLAEENEEKQNRKTSPYVSSFGEEARFCTGFMIAVILQFLGKLVENVSSLQDWQLSSEESSICTSSKEGFTFNDLFVVRLFLQMTFSNLQPDWFTLGSLLLAFIHLKEFTGMYRRHKIFDPGGLQLITTPSLFR